MKKSLLLVVTLSFLLFPLVINAEKASAQTQGVIGVETKYEDRRGANFTVSIYGDNLSNLAGGSFELRYDGNVLNVQSVAKVDALDTATFAHNITDHSVKVAWASAAGIDVKESNLIEVSFRLTTANASSNLTLHDVMLFDTNGNKINARSFNGKVTPFKGEQKKAANAVSGNKEWVITFNRAVHPSTVNANAVYVVNSRGERIPTSPKLSADRKTLTVTPVGNYTSGDYKLMVTEQLRTEKGFALKKPVQFSFTVN